jgi:hypothetical protein
VLLAGKTLTAKSFSLFLPKRRQKFIVEKINLKLEKEPNNPNKLRLNLDGINILERFRQKYREFQKSIGIRVRQEPRRKGG